MAMYDSRHINQKQDAIPRSREIHHRNSLINHYSEGNNEQVKILHDKITNQEKNYVIKRKRYNKNDLNDILNKIFDGKIDSDKLIIIALMILLLKEGADIKLIIALGYILL